MVSVPARYIRWPLALLAAGVLTLIAISLIPGGSAEADANALGVAVGEGHSCAVTNSAGVKCWGDNEFGQLGNGTDDSTTIPLDVCADASCEEPLGGIVAVTADRDHSCALTSEGSVLCWGWNEDGQLGDGTTTDRMTPVPVVGLASGVTSISAGWNHTCAVVEGGGVKCWGNNDRGQLGDNTEDSSTIPVDVCEPPLVVIAGGAPLLCLPMADATSVSAGGNHTCAVTTETGVKCWGYNNSGQLGNGTTTKRHTPDDVCEIVFKPLGALRPSGKIMIPCTPVSGIVAVSAGFAHTCALKEDTGVICWGENDLGQLGDNTTEDSVYPVDVCQVLVAVLEESALSGIVLDPCLPVGGMASVSAAAGHTCATITTGAARCWGWNPAGKLGDDSMMASLTPVNVSGLSNATQIAAAFAHTCAAREGGGVRCWGDNSAGQLGDGTNVDRLTPVNTFGLGGKPTATPTEAPATPTATQAPATETSEPMATATATITPTATPEPGGLIGDVDCSGEVNAIDAAFVLQFVAGLVAELPCPLAADANQDMEVNTIDAALILQVSAGLLGMLPP